MIPKNQTKVGENSLHTVHSFPWGSLTSELADLWNSISNRLSQETAHGLWADQNEPCF